MKISCLVVEGDGFQRWLLEQLLWELKASRVSSAPGARAALEALDDAHFDVVIADLEMLGLDGLKFLRRISESCVAPAVIVSSAQGAGAVASAVGKAQACGVRVLGYVPKPTTKAKLKAALAGVARGHEGSGDRLDVSVVTPEDIAKALHNAEMDVWFQPKVRVATGQVAGAEALARWVRPGRAALFPERFLSSVERAGLLPRFTDMVVSRACKGCAAWRASGLEAGVAFNMSAALLAGRDVADALTAIVVSYGLRPSDVTVELNDAEIPVDAVPMLETLARFRARGFGLSISHLAHAGVSVEKLRRMPVTELKIDQGLVRAAAAGAGSREIVEAVLRTARELQFTTVAEGVETHIEWRFVREMGFDIAQGWKLGKPMPLSRFIEASSGPL